VRDPLKTIEDEQLNGGEIVPLEKRDWDLILPYLRENEKLFGISVEEDLLLVDGRGMNPLDVYRKVKPKSAPDFSKDSLEEWE
jgi:hypothetical protein